MKIICVKDYHAMSDFAAKIVLSLVRSKQRVNLGLATGSSPLGLYQCMIEDYRKHATSFQNVFTFNLDEYVGLDETCEQSYRSFMNKHLFRHINIPMEQTFIPNGKAVNLEAECKEYENIIQAHGGIDLQILGIGKNGHIGFNEPGTPFYSRTHVVKLSTSTREANARYFSSSEVPTHAITMGIHTIMASRQILLLVSGERKADVMKRMVTTKPTEKLPATVLKHHPNVVVIADEAALKYVDKTKVEMEMIDLCMLDSE